MRVLRRHLLLLFPVALASLAGPADPSRAQEIEWTVRDAEVRAGGPVLPHVEPHVAADPVNPDHLLVGTIVAGPEGPPWHCAALATFDGGENWRRTDFEGMERCIDPWVVALAGGEALFAAIEIRRDAEGPGRFRLHLHRSQDGGRTWTPEPDTLGRRYEHPILVASRPSGDETIHLAALRFTGGSDGDEPLRQGWVGRLEGPRRTGARRTALLPPAPGLIVTGLAPLADGALVLLYRDFHRHVDGSVEEGTLVHARGWAVRSEDGGRTFGRPVLVDDGCASGRFVGAFPGYPTAAADRSDGPFRDRIYHACVRPKLEGVSVSRSTDGGRSWSDPVRVDAAGEAPGTPHARTPMVAASPDGTVAVAWYDRRHDPDGACQDVYLTVSADGGDTFTRPVRVTEATSCPEGEGNGRVARSWPMGGDYGSLAAAADGTFHLVWADSRSGRFRLRRAAFRVSTP